MSRRRCERLAPLRAEPRDDVEQVTQALPGEPLDVEEERGEWARVRTAYDYPGWMHARVLGVGALGEWLVERDGDPVEEARASPWRPGLLRRPHRVLARRGPDPARYCA
jgi:hypothetical protein